MVRAWLMRNGPSSLDQVATQLENYFLAKRASQLEIPGVDKAGGRGRGKARIEEHP